jgi:hypothetical protein
VISELHSLLATAQSSQEYSVLEKSIKAFLSLISISTLSPLIMNSLQEQVSVFQRGHLLDQLSVLASEGCRLFDSMNYNRYGYI